MAIFTFVGVTTGQSSIMAIFPQWMQALGRPEVTIRGVDFPLHDRPERYRRLVEEIKGDPEQLGGLVTSHKIDLLAASRDLFDELTPHAAHTGEVSSLAKRDGRLIGHVTDPEAGGASLHALLGDGYFGRTGGHLLLLGGGGAATALVLYLMERPQAADRPLRIVVAEKSAQRLARLQNLTRHPPADLTFEWIHSAEPAACDQALARLQAGSVVINATGMGKDLPGSPLTNAARFPQDGVIWELNYRGERPFLAQANAQAAEQNLKVADGWTYFLHGWAGVISHVLDLPIDGAAFHRLTAVAAANR